MNVHRENAEHRKWVWLLAVTSVRIKGVVEIFVWLLQKQTKQQKQIQEHLLVYKYTWGFFSDFVVPITACASFSGVPRSRNISRRCSGYSSQIKAACATFIKARPAQSCRGQMHWGTCAYQTSLLLPSFYVFCQMLC